MWHSLCRAPAYTVPTFAPHFPSCPHALVCSMPPACSHYRSFPHTCPVGNSARHTVLTSTPHFPRCMQALVAGTPPKMWELEEQRESNVVIEGRRGNTEQFKPGVSAGLGFQRFGSEFSYL